MKGYGLCNGGTRDFSPLSSLSSLPSLPLTTACAVDPGAGTSAARPPSARTPAGSTNKHHGGGFAPSTAGPTGTLHDILR